MLGRGIKVGLKVDHAGRQRARHPRADGTGAKFLVDGEDGGPQQTAGGHADSSCRGDALDVIEAGGEYQWPRGAGRACEADRASDREGGEPQIQRHSAIAR